MENTIKSGTCPKCGSSEVYNDENLTKRTKRDFIGISFSLAITVTTHVCTSCGYIEEYMQNDNLKNEKIINGIKNSWHKEGITDGK